MIRAIAGSSRAVIFSALVCGLFAACSQPEEAPADDAAAPPTSESAAAPSTATAAAASEGPSAVHGVVTWDGDIPKRVPLQTRQDPKCAEMHGSEPLLSDYEVVNEDGQVKNVFVYIDNPPDGDYALPADAIVLDQVGCMYTPHVFGLRAGQDIFAKNSDDTLHNVRIFARKNRASNMGQPAGSDPRKARVHKKEEMEIKVKCDVHPWMTAYMFVMGHPFFAVTDENGAFEIPELPAGEYTIIAWHERWGEKEMTITVGGDEHTHADFVFSK